MEGSTIGNYEQGIREMSVRVATRLATALQTHPAYLLGLIDEDELELLQAPKAVRSALLHAMRELTAATYIPGATPNPLGPVRPLVRRPPPG